MPVNRAIESALAAELGDVHYRAKQAARIEAAAVAYHIANYLDAMEGKDDAESNEPHQRRGD